MAVRAAADLLDNKKTSPWIDKMLAINPGHGEGFALVGHFFVLNRRYEEGIAMYRKALEANPNLHSARSELGVQLMRLGLEKEARQQLESAFQAGFRDAATANSLTLIDSYKRFKTFSGGNMIVKLHQKEAEQLAPYFLSELGRAIATYEKKYKLKLDKPVQVEVYPDHEDFAVRTLGMPGLGALGVTFGHVVAMDSPSGRKPGTFHWASTLWHELSHVFVLTATKHRVPRWFTEGMAVHEETAVSPDWGDRLDPQVIQAIKGKKLLPVAQLDRGFVRPSYPAQVVVSYFQAGRICDYINEKWGYDKLLAMMHSFGEAKTTPQVFETVLGTKTEAFDEQFMAWLNKEVGPTVQGYDSWLKKIKETTVAARSKQHNDVIALGKEAIALYPEYVEGVSGYELVADALTATGDKEGARLMLESYSKIGGRNPDTLMKLAKWQDEAGKPQDAIRTLERLAYVYPMGEDLHKRLGDLYLGAGKIDGAVREFTALAGSNTVDQAGVRYNLARALLAAKRTEEAKEQLLLALEAAPGYKPAQRLLLELSR
jgi:tetratricopeptide (TPR) repeat protein